MLFFQGNEFLALRICDCESSTSGLIEALGKGKYLNHPPTRRVGWRFFTVTNGWGDAGVSVSVSGVSLFGRWRLRFSLQSSPFLVCKARRGRLRFGTFAILGMQMKLGRLLASALLIVNGNSQSFSLESLQNPLHLPNAQSRHSGESLFSGEATLPGIVGEIGQREKHKFFVGW